MEKASKFIIILLLATNQIVVAQRHSTIDIVKVKNIYEKEAMAGRIGFYTPVFLGGIALPIG